MPYKIFTSPVLISLCMDAEDFFWHKDEEKNRCVMQMQFTGGVTRDGLCDYTLLVHYKEEHHDTVQMFRYEEFEPQEDIQKWIDGMVRPAPEQTIIDTHVQCITLVPGTGLSKRVVLVYLQTTQ